ncbi:MAG: HAD-IC family P-type ATPase, partial [Planctomycetes bacterium]|nr:HAD-IC family P-type ATPase [Planctomycetota bacterium]
MARRGVIVRKLAAVEGLGSCTLVATDKTGTLTCNELTVREVRLADGQRLDVTGEGFAPAGAVLRDGAAIDRSEIPLLDQLARAAVLCNEADFHARDGGWVWRGDAVDVAFLSFAHKLGWSREGALDAHPQITEIPFEPERQFAASFHPVDGEDFVFVKGAPERVLAMCELSPEEAQRQTAAAEEMGARGLRVLALAAGPVSHSVDAAEVPPHPAGLTLLGLAGMIDPLRPGVREAVQSCGAAGVRVCMVTGDHRITALAIARDLGLDVSPSQVVTGAELEARSAEEMAGTIGDVVVFARVAPQQKLQIVEAARKAGHFVAVTGDGVNDAPALRNANIGVAMGRSGTDVAREAAELVISDDNFATIISGIEEGRIAYDNVRKVIYLLVSTGAAEIVLVMLAVVTGSPLPLLPVQLLWLNLVTNGIQDVALAFEPGEEDVLRRKPRPPRERIFNQLMIERTVVAAAVIGGVGFGAFHGMLNAGMPEDSARSALLLLMVLFENVHIANCRSETKSAFLLSPLRSPILLAGTLTAFLIHVAAMHLPIGRAVLQTEPAAPQMWAVLVGLALTVFAAMELHKLSWAKRRGTPHPLLRGKERDA